MEDGKEGGIVGGGWKGRWDGRGWKGRWDGRWRMKRKVEW